MKILVTPTSFQPGKGNPELERLQAFCPDLVFNETGKPLAGEDLIQRLQGCDGYIAGLDFITADVLRACPGLKVISRYGVGYDRVDRAAAAEAGITVTNTPGVNAEAVGELAVALMLSVARRVPYLDRQTREGAWIRSTGMELRGKTVGILGLGAIGKVVARCCAGIGMTVTAYDPYINADYCAEHKIAIKTLEEILTESDVISLHLPLTEETNHMIDGAAIAKMRDGAIVINTSRGGIVDETAAAEALRSDKLGGLGLDAFEQEPPTGSPLFDLLNVVVTPHTGAHTKEATENMARMAVDNLIAELSGRDCGHRVR